MHELDPTLGRVVGGRYEVTSRIGRGGMGAVYVARQQLLDRDVALKLIRVDLAYDPEVVARFEREARAVARLQHPHIVVVHDFGADDGVLFLAMERLVGVVLGEELRRAGRLQLASALRITRDIASALACAHAAGVVHRDLKPDNIMLVVTDDREDHAKVLDFGIAKIAGGSDPAVTTSRMVLGTPGFVAPEVILHGMSDDPRTDLYALGMLLFQMLAGRAPFVATSAGGILIAQAAEDPPRLETLVADVPAAVCDLVARLTAKKPDARPASARDVVESLDRLLGRGGSGLLRLELPPPSTTLSFETSPSQALPTPSTATQSLASLVGGVVIAAEQPQRRRRWPLALAAAAFVGLLGATSVIAMTAAPPATPTLSAPTASLTATASRAATPPAPLPEGREAEGGGNQARAPATAVLPTTAAATTPEAGATTTAAAPTTAEPTTATAEPMTTAAATKTAAATTTTKTAATTKKKPATTQTLAVPEPPKAEKPALTSALIKTGIESSLGKASSCTNTNIKKAPAGSGVLVDHCPSYKTVAGDHQVVLTVAPDGSVVGARYADDTAATRIGACALESFKSWKLPAFTAEAPVEINQRVLFEPCVPINGKCIF